MMESKPKLLFINVERNYGIRGTIRKAFAQYQALQEMFTVDFIYIKREVTNRYIRAIFFYGLFPVDVLIKAISNKGCYIYYRYYPHNLLLNIIIYFLRKYCKIYVEVNTKYRFETKDTNKWFYFSNYISEKMIYRSAQAVLPVTKDMGNYVKSVYPNSRIIILGNGYDPVDYDFKNKINYDELKGYLQKGENKLKFIWVGTPFLWHGLDRMLQIISQLDNAVLFIVGNSKKLHEIIKLYNSKNYRIFCLGERNLQELQVLYNICDFGLGSFGLDRLNITDGAPLKVREYLYYGLPVIIGYYDGQLEGLEFVHQYTDLETLKLFLKKRFDREKIKKYAREQLSWRTIMRNLFGPELSHKM
jgi:hypothetical protein